MAHDAGAALIDNGRVVGLVQRERVARHKRCALITAYFLETALKQLGTTWADIDMVAVSMSQAWPYIFVDPERFRFDYDATIAERLPVTQTSRERMLNGIKYIKSQERTLSIRTNLISRGVYGEYIIEDLNNIKPNWNTSTCLEWPNFMRHWMARKSSLDISVAIQKVREVESEHYGYMPIEVNFNGKSKPGVLVPHHLSHAAYSYYNSKSEKSAVATLDNGDVFAFFTGYVGGVFALGLKNRLRVIDFRFAYEAHLYQRVAERIGLGGGGGAGKLMGLAPYGEPLYASEAFIGDARAVFGDKYSFDHKEDRNHVLRPLLDAEERYCRAHGAPPSGVYSSLDPSANGNSVVIEANTRLAASAQKIFEENTLASMRRLHAGLREAGLDIDTVCLGGGGALNCPANSRLAREGPFNRVIVPPAVDDSGLPIGAAQAVAHDIFGEPVHPRDPDQATMAYLGGSYDGARVERAIAAAGDAIRVVETEDPAADAALALVSDRVVAWFEGRSEIGPRALGHRSILADARHKENWSRVNRLKQREDWRPFAPAVLKEKAADWFDGPLPSPHMLFTAQVKGDRLPAITHVDGSARVQTVGEEVGGLRRILERFDAETGVPVLLNTSFNGPGEPIVETPEEAIAFLRSTEIDAVYIEGKKLVRR